MASGACLRSRAARLAAIAAGVRLAAGQCDTISWPWQGPGGVTMELCVTVNSDTSLSTAPQDPVVELNGSRC